MERHPAIRNAGGGTPQSKHHRPHYQDGIGLPGNQRVVPDVAFVAAPPPSDPYPCAMPPAAAR